MILQQIIAAKEEELRAAQAREPLAALRTRALAALPPRPLVPALAAARGRQGGTTSAAVRGAPHGGHEAAPQHASGRGGAPAVIAEVKLRSPSAGPIRPGADPVAIACDYEAAGAAAVSVLTDGPFFGGSLEHLAAVRARVGIPVLRKDFLIDEYELFRARAAGADAVLLIVAVLGPARLADLWAVTCELGMEALVETHDEAEVDVAVRVGARVVGINHRNLATLEIDRSLTARLRPRIPVDRWLVAESGLRGPEDLVQAVAAGADAVLVGEALMRAPSPGAALQELLGARPSVASGELPRRNR